MTSFYDESYFSRQASGYVFDKERGAVFGYHLKRILSLVGKADSILDVGCGFGYFLSLCEQAGIQDVCGLEVSGYAVARAREYTQADVSQVDNLQTQFADKQFDVVTAFDVVEHTEKDREMLEFVYRRLRPGGVLYGTTPNARWFARLMCWRREAEHINVQRRRYWVDLLKEVGFQGVDLRLVCLFGFPPGQILRKWLGAVHIRPVFTPIELLGQEIVFVAKKP